MKASIFVHYDAKHKKTHGSAPSQTRVGHFLLISMLVKGFFDLIHDTFLFGSLSTAFLR